MTKSAIKTTAIIEEEEFQPRTYKDSTWYIVFKQFCRNKVAVAGLVIILLLALLAIFAPLINPYDYSEVNPLAAHQLPSKEHWFGTDKVGRDIFSRITFGARYSLFMAIAASLMGTFIGIVFGLIAGYFGGKTEAFILRFCDILQSIPNLLLCIVISISLGVGVFPTICALSIGSIPMITRLLRASMLSVRDQEFVEAARATNCGKLRIMVKQILPNCIAPVIVTFTTSTGMKVMSLASLSFLGLGIKEPTPEWGAMINAGRGVLRYYPHVVLFPGLFIAILVLSLNMVGDGLRDALDPKLRS